MSFDGILQRLSALDANLYDFALWTEKEGLRQARLQPCSNCLDSYSVAKAFVMTAVGLLADDGLLSPTDTFARHFPHLRRHPELGWRVALVEHALTHRLGWGERFLDVDVEDQAAYPTEEWLDMVFDRPLSYLPGTRYVYSDAATYLLSRLAAKVSGMGVDSLLQQRLFRPMGIGETAWSRCPQGYPVGATGLYISAADTVKLGALYLCEGRWQGKQLLSPSWVQRAVGREYEFRILTPGGLVGKTGFFGQGLVFSRENGFAAAWHAYTDYAALQRVIACMDTLRPEDLRD